MELTPGERAVILVSLFELQVTRSAFDDDPHADRIPIARIGNDPIRNLVEKLGGDPAKAHFGAFGDDDYPADETDEG
jgi:hypothetical protein